MCQFYFWSQIKRLIIKLLFKFTLYLSRFVLSTFSNKASDFQIKQTNNIYILNLLHWMYELTSLISPAFCKFFILTYYFYLLHWYTHTSVSVLKCLCLCLLSLLFQDLQSLPSCRQNVKNVYLGSMRFATSLTVYILIARATLLLDGFSSTCLLLF